MTTTARPNSPTRVAADPTRNHARAAGAFYLITFAASIPALLMIKAAVGPDLTVATGHDNGLLAAGSSTSSTPLLASAPPSRCTRSSSGRTRPWRSAWSCPG